MAGRDGIWGGMAVGAAVATLGLGALSLTAPQPAGNSPPEAPAVAPPEVAPPALADMAALAHVAPAAASVLRTSARPGPPTPGAEGAEAGAPIDTASAAVPETSIPSAILARPEPGRAPTPPAGEAWSPVSAVAAQPGALLGAEAPTRPDTSLTPVSAPRDGGVAAVVFPPRPPQAAMAAQMAPPLAAEAAPSMSAASSDPRPASVGRSEGAAMMARDSRPGVEASRSAAPLAIAEALPGGLGKGPNVPHADSGLYASAPSARRDASPPSGAPVRLVAPDAARARPANLGTPQVPSHPRVAAQAGTASSPTATPPLGAAAASSFVPAAPANPGEPARMAPQGGFLPGTGAAVQVDLSDRMATTRAGAASAVPPPTDAPALQRFAAPLAPWDGRPLLSVVLLDDGAADGPAAVAALPLVVSVALDPSAPNVTERMAAYRARGIEVLAVVRLPLGARPAGAAAQAEAMLTALPDAVAVLDLGEAALEPGSVATGAALRHFAETGLGAVLTTQTPGAAARVTAASIPAAAVLRDLDGAGQDAGAVRRFLDDAARRAGEAGEGVVLARVRPETLEALALWAGGRRAREVALAPVSAVLRQE